MISVAQIIYIYIYNMYVVSRRFSYTFTKRVYGVKVLFFSIVFARCPIELSHEYFLKIFPPFSNISSNVIIVRGALAEERFYIITALHRSDYAYCVYLNTVYILLSVRRKKKRHLSAFESDAFCRINNI